MKFLIPFALLSLAPVASQAAMVQFLYQSTLLDGVPGTDIEAGDEFFITITLDNGGGLESGVWTTHDVRTVTYQVGAGSGIYSYTFDVEDADYVWNQISGNFSTNAAGIIIGAPFNWSGVKGNWSGNPDSAIFHNSGNPIVFLSLDGVLLRDANSFRNVQPDAWTATVVPEPSSALLGGLGALVLLRRRRR